MDYLDIVVEIKPYIYFATGISVMLLYYMATRYQHDNAGINLILVLTSLSFFHSIYYMFNIKENDPQAVELECFKSVFKFAFLLGCVSFILWYLTPNK